MLNNASLKNERVIGNTLSPKCTPKLLSLEHVTNEGVFLSISVLFVMKY